MKVVVTKQARKDIAKLQPDLRKKVYDTLFKFAKSQERVDVKKLTGRFESRLRVGDYRILIKISSEEIMTVYASECSIAERYTGRSYGEGNKTPRLLIEMKKSKP